MSKEGVALILASKPGMKHEEESDDSSAADKAASAAFDDFVSALGLDLDDDKAAEAKEALHSFVKACYLNSESDE